MRFDEEVEEYQVETRNGGYSLIRHCPWCGGAAPSKRASLFAKVSSAEVRRLSRLTANLKTVEDALANFGEPDHRDPTGLTIHTPARGRRAAQVETFPTMTFSKNRTDPDSARRLGQPEELTRQEAPAAARPHPAPPSPSTTTRSPRSPTPRSCI